MRTYLSIEEAAMVKPFYSEYCCVEWKKFVCAAENTYVCDRNLDSPVLWAGNWNQLCVSCKIVRPLRAKHCAVTDRCIEVSWLLNVLLMHATSCLNYKIYHLM